METECLRFGGQGYGGHPPGLLDDYVAISRRRPRALAATALRTRSLAARAILCHAAVGGAVSLDQLLAVARGGTPRGLPRDRTDPRALADLARVIALQDLLPDDRTDGVALYDLTLARFGPRRVPPDHQGLHTQLAYDLGHHRRVRELLRAYDRMPQRVRADLELDLMNPFAGADGGDAAGWLAGFRRLLPDPAPVLAGDGPAPFDRLAAKAPGQPGRGVGARLPATELISVIVTSYQPDTGLLTAVRSLLQQSWTNLEIVLVDDASPSECDALIKECVELDPRIRLIKLPGNAGTYAARNAGLDAAAGAFVTFQDSDDWSHPRRLERQVRPLLENGSLMATVSEAIRVGADLTLTRQPGRDPRIINTSSLMVRKHTVVGRIGYFDSVRKAADSEYLKRIEAAFGADAVDRITDGIYALIRLTPVSLSRADFRTGWMHPARLAYKSAYELWHQQIAAGEARPYLPKHPAARPFAAPAHVCGDRDGRRAGVPARRYDVVFASEWRRFGGPQKSMLEEIQALTRRGLRVAVVQLEAYRFMSNRREPLCRAVQELINAGTVDHVLLSDQVEASLLILRYPPVLQFAAAEPSRLRAKRVVILANQAPSELDGSDHRYAPRTCTEVAERMFTIPPVWCPQGPAVRDRLAGELRPFELTPYDMPGIIDLDGWSVDRSRFRSRMPVVGKHSRDNWAKWPADRQTLLRVYPDSPVADVRFMGGVKALLALLGTRRLPAGWLVYDYDEVSVRCFLHQLDFYVYFPHPNMVEAFGRSILEALASGCVVILPHHFSRTFGDAALYRHPHEVWPTIQRYYSEPGLFREQSERAREQVARRFSHDAYAQLILELIS